MRIFSTETEIGHNMDLLHSGESQAYDDQSGMVSTRALEV